MKLPNGFKKILWGVSGFLFVSGALVWVFSRWIRITSSLGEEHHPLEVWLTRAHSVMAYAILVVFGYLIKIHIEPGLRQKDKKRSGVSMLSAFAILSVTALLILYASDGIIRSLSTQIHTYLGLGMPILLGAHLLKRKRKASRQRKNRF